ncbi:MAG: hypothetical protein N2042_03475 [Thermodesulfovibrio sp.]|nr:hypothetical protein [Thermodesulfovibrio sp.]MDW7972549.1 hypothetical protein [Thermodesulfovibrio sp.]
MKLQVETYPRKKLLKAVNRSGTVLPVTLAIARMIPVRIPGAASL